MLRETRVTFAYSGFVLLGLVDLIFRFFWLERENWTCNAGIFWGIELPPVVLVGVVSLLLVYIGHLFLQAKHFEERFFLLLILLGGGGNLLDRLFYDCVLDYFSWPLGFSNFLPNFNLADMMLLLGLIGLGGTFLKRKH